MLCFYHFFLACLLLVPFVPNMYSVTVRNAIKANGARIFLSGNLIPSYLPNKFSYMPEVFSSLENCQYNCEQEVVPTYQNILTKTAIFVRYKVWKYNCPQKTYFGNLQCLFDCKQLGFR